ncbi:Uncharacterized protein ALO64_03681, partial [Pseudomonas meliae]
MESVYTRNCIEGSNPSFTAILRKPCEFSCLEFMGFFVCTTHSAASSRRSALPLPRWLGMCIHSRRPHTLLQARQLLSLTTRQPVALSAQDKILWVLMKDRHDYFTGEGKLWFDNQNHIASACACSLTVAKAFIKKLREHGYLTIEKRRIHGCAYSNSMTITRDLILASMSPLDVNANQ